MESHSVQLAQNFFISILIIFIAGTVVSKTAHKFGIPDVVLFMLTGVLIGPSVLGLVNISATSTLNQVILLFGASFILFHGGLVTRLAVLKAVWRSITLLSTLGVVITALIVGMGAHFILGIPFMITFLLGALLASTDPAALVPIFQRLSIREKVAQTVISESAFTDATGAILTTVMFGLVGSTKAAISWWDVGLQFMQLALGGVVAGALVGGIAAFLISENDRDLLRKFTPMVVVITVLASYVIAEWIHASGFMSAFVAGLMVGNAKSFKLTVLPTEERAMHEFIDAIGLNLRMLIFVLLGTQVNFMVLREHGLRALLVVMVFMLIARPLTVLCSVLPDRRATWKTNEILFLFWTRETGVIAAVLMGIVSSSHLPESDIMSSVTFVAILLTLVVQASTTPFVAKVLNLLERHESV